MFDKANADKWCYSDNEEHFGCDPVFDTREEAIAAGIEEYQGATFFTGQICLHIPKIDADDVIERMGERAAEECGDVSDMWPYAKKEDIQILSHMLNDVLNRWMALYGHEPNFCSIINIDEWIPEEETV